MKVYYAKSIFSSVTFWVNVGTAFVVIMDLTEVQNIVPDGWMPTVTAAVAAVNVLLRMRTTRPVAFVRPGETKPVPVKTLHPE